MPRTPPTIVAPLPNDPRVFALAKASGLTTREAFAAAAEVWAWVSVMAVDDIVVNTAPDSLDAVVDVPGFGPAMVQAGLVGTVDNGLVLPAELRRRAGGQRGGRAAADAEDQDDKVERERKQARVRQRRRRATKTLTKPVTTTTSPQTVAEDTGMKRTPRRLGEVEGYSVMLLFSRQGVPFYKLAGATPKEFTGTVSDPDNPSLGDAFIAILHSMKRESQKGLGMRGTDFRPSIDQVVVAARKEKAGREPDHEATVEPMDAAQPAAASMTDQQDTTTGPVRSGARPQRTLCARNSFVVRDKSVTVTDDQRDTVTVTEVSRPESVTCQPNSNGVADLRNVNCHAPVTEPAPSSSSISLSSSSLSKDNEEERRKKTQETTTTSGVTLADRDRMDDILDRMLDQVVHEDDTAADDDTLKRRERKFELAKLFAQSLGVNVATVLNRWRAFPKLLQAQLEEKGIDPNTGRPVARGAPHEPAGAHGDTEATTEASAGDKPAAGSVGARGGGEPDEDFDQQRVRLAEGLRKVVVSTAADIGVKYA